MPAGSTTITATIVSNPSQQGTFNLTAGATTPVLLKAGPAIAAVIPAAALVTPRNIAPGTFISIYGTELATATAAEASPTPFPTVLGGTQVLVNGTAIPLQYVSANQVNAVFPVMVTGLVTVAVTTTVGKNTVNVLTQAAVPAVFTTDGTVAAALNAVTGVVVTPSAPLHGGDYVSLFRNRIRHYGGRLAGDLRVCYYPTGSDSSRSGLLNSICRIVSAVPRRRSDQLSDTRGSRCKSCGSGYRYVEWTFQQYGDFGFAITVN